MYSLLTANAIGFPSVSTGSGEQTAAILIVIALVMTYRVYGNMKGRRFREMSVYQLPAIYLILTVISLLALNPSYIDMAAVALSILFGYLVGLRLAGGVQFFEKEGVTYYKRSPFVMIIWLISFTARFGINALYPANFLLAISVEVILAGTTGLIMGEAVHISRGYKEHKRYQPQS